MEKIFWPLPLFSDIEAEVLNEGLVLRKIEDSELAMFFGVKYRELNSSGLIERISPCRGGYFPIDNETGDLMTLHILNDSERLFSSNYVVETVSRDEAESFNKTLKLMFLGGSGLFVGFQKGKRSLVFLYPNPYFTYPKANKFQNFNIEAVSIFKEIYSLIENKSIDKKFNLIMEKYLNSISGTHLRVENRFLELMIILEMLYLPENHPQLQCFNLSRRVMDVFSKDLSGGVLLNEDEIRKLYKIRCDLVHDGFSKYLDESYFLLLLDIVRNSILIYLRMSDFSSNLLPLKKKK